MLKKAGIVVAATVAVLLALSPLAFAGDYEGGGDDGGHSSHHGHHGSKNTQSGLVNLQNTNVSVPIQLCNNSVLEGVLGVLASGQRNSDSHGGKCSQDNSADN
ncbi:MAG TPA: hypothetical protein VGM60_10775 [Pseudonocardia sp.]|uniref:hypothetical protein n=1 Tax=Pseudonocardia sp. TaxID=60912 RepID=UPI002F40F610